MLEEWRVIPDSVPYQEYYVSNLGRIANCKWEIKAQRMHGLYLVVRLHTPKGQQDRKVHQLVCEAFNGLKPFPEAQCLHKDDIKSRNVPDNLYWGTHQDNMDDMIRNRRLMIC